MSVWLDRFRALKRTEFVALEEVFTLLDAAGLGGEGTQGPKGDPGDPGPQGIQGPTGPTGLTGAQGIQGATGPTGPTGEAGPAGTDGAPGPQGIQGIQGPAGTNGTNGTGAPVHATLANGTTAMALGTNTSVKVTPTATATFQTTVPPAGTRCAVIVLTSGTTSYTITFGSGFKPVSTLATGTVTGKVFVINFISDGTSLYEAGRTAAMNA